MYHVVHLNKCLRKKSEYKLERLKKNESPCEKKPNKYMCQVSYEDGIKTVLDTYTEWMKQTPITNMHMDTRRQKKKIGLSS